MKQCCQYDIVMKRGVMERGGNDILAVYSRILPRLQIKHTRPNPLVLPTTNLPLPIKIPHRFRQQPRYIRMFFLQNIPHLMTTHNITFPSLQRFRNTQQPHDIPIISVKELSRIGPVNAHFMYLSRIIAYIFHVAEDMAPSVLTDEVSEIGPETHVCDG